jgi:hypothetical protein
MSAKRLFFVISLFRCCVSGQAQDTKDATVVKIRVFENSAGHVTPAMVFITSLYGFEKPIKYFR